MEIAEYQEEPITQEIDGEPLSLIKLAPELKLPILKICLMLIIENNDILDPFRDVLEFIKIAIRINKKHFRPFKNDLILFAYHYAREFFAQEKSNLTQSQLNKLLEQKVLQFYMEGTQVAKSNRKKRYKIAQLLIAGANPNQRTMIFSVDGPNNLLFHIACARDKRTWPALIPLLIFYGTPIHTKSSNGDSPLKVAIKRKNINMVEILLDHGSEVNQSILDLAILQQAFSNDITDIARMVQEKFNEQNHRKSNRCIAS